MVSRIEGEILPSESKERFIQNHGVWMAGLLSAGGTLEIYSIIEDSTQKAAACVTFPANDYSKVQTLLQLMGGRIYSYSPGQGESSKYNWTWKVETPDEVWPLTSAVLPHMPTHSHYAEYSKPWDQMTDEERFRAARKAQTRVTTGTVSKVSAQMYRHLLTDPQFVAGAAVDARASLYVGYQYEQDLPTVEVYSANKPLMEALYGQFGGELKEKASRQTGKHQTVWRLDYIQGKNLYNFVRPYLLLRAEQAARVFE